MKLLNFKPKTREEKKISQEAVLDKAKRILKRHSNHKKLLERQDKIIRSINDRLHHIISHLQDDAYQDIILLEDTKRDKYYNAIKYTTNYLSAYTLKIDRDSRFGEGYQRNLEWIKIIRKSDEILGNLFVELEKIPHLKC